MELPQQPDTLKIFFSYAPEDQVWLTSLDRHLSLLKRQKQISSWHRQHIQPGYEWRRESLHHLTTAHIIVLLVSAHFLTSEYCYGFEMQQALERHRRKEAIVVPILVRPVDWIDAPFAELQALPRNGKAISSWRDKDQAWVEIVHELRDLIARLPLRTVPTPPQPSRGPTTLPAIWNVPHRRNPFFTGRDEFLERLRMAFSTSVAPFTQPIALSSMGGMGKTQIALEYTYLQRQHYQAVLWLNASSHETLLTNLIKMAHLLQLVESDEQNIQEILHAVQIWLITQRNWLLIIDDLHVSALPTVRDDLLPEQWHGHVLLTTRIQPIEPFAHTMMLDKMPDDIARIFLLKRAHLLTNDASEEELQSVLDNEAVSQLVALLDGLPLALDQAGAYIYEKGATAAGYLQLFQTQRKELLRRHSNLSKDYTISFQATWSLAFREVEHISQAAIELLRFCAFLAPEHIPDALLVQSSALLNLSFALTTNDLLTFHDAIGTLLMYSLIQRQRGSAALSLHRLVQAALQDEMELATQQQWADLAVRALAQIFPKSDFAQWEQCETLLPHALACADHIERWQMASQEAALLLYRTGDYLVERARHAEARHLLERSLAMYQQTQGPAHLDTAECLLRLGDLFMAEDDEEQAYQHWQQALNIHMSQCGPQHPDTARCIFNLARIALQQGDYLGAETQLQHALSIYERTQVDPQWQADCLDLLNTVSYFLGKYAQQQQYVQKALYIRMQASGANHPNTARNLHARALYFIQANVFEQALPLLQQALEIREQVLGDHHRTALILEDLGLCNGPLGNVAEAEHCYQRALDMYRRVLGSTHPSVANCLTNLADFLLEEGQFKQAEQHYQQALALYRQNLGGEHMKVIDGLRKIATCLQHQIRYDQATQLFQQATVICQRKWGPDHIQTIESTRQLAYCYYVQGQIEQAEPLLQQAFASIEHMDWKSPFAIQVLGHMIQLAAQQGKPEHIVPLMQHLSLLLRDASQNNAFFALYFMLMQFAIPTLQHMGNEVLLRSSLPPMIAQIEDIIHQIPVGQRTLLTSLLQILASLYALQEDSYKALAYLQEQLALLEQLRGPRHADTIANLKMQILILSSPGESEEHHQRALTLYARLQHMGSLDATTCGRIGYILEEQGQLEEALAIFEQAIQFNPDDSWVYMHKSWTLSDLERYEDALCAIEQAILLDPNISLFYRKKSSILSDLERYEDALCAIEQAILLDPNDSWLYQRKSCILLDLKRYEDALCAIEQAIFLAPDKQDFYSQRDTMLDYMIHRKIDPH